jgi:hypothetical protein
MHVLTKIFVVLVSLLAVMLVPLIVVYTANEDSYQKLHQQAQDRALAARSALTKAEEGFGIQVAQKDAEIERLTGEVVGLQKVLGERQVEIRRLETSVAENEVVNDQILSRLSTLAKSVEAGEMLTSSLIDELRELRRDALASQRQKVELDEALRETTAQLDVAEEARRFLQEELQRVKEEQARAFDDLGRYVAQYGRLADSTRASTGTLPDKALVAGVTRVRQQSGQHLVEIDAGQRDGVKKDWKMTIGEGGRFVATIRIIEVDINRSVGVVETRNGSIEIGQRAYATPAN